MQLKAITYTEFHAAAGCEIDPGRDIGAIDARMEHRLHSELINETKLARRSWGPSWTELISWRATETVGPDRFRGVVQPVVVDELSVR